MAEVGRRTARKPQAPSAREAVKERLSPVDILKSIGPGVITGGADNDPAGIATYSIVGATAGFAQNWLLFRSEERRVGKECRSGCSTYDDINKTSAHNRQ